MLVLNLLTLFIMFLGTLLLFLGKSEIRKTRNLYTKEIIIILKGQKLLIVKLIKYTKKNY